jgi:hypothetical protein
MGRNHEIIGRHGEGERVTDIAQRMSLTVGTVTGVLYRDRNPKPNLRAKARAAGIWPVCHHPRTPENTQRIGKAGVRCRTCRRKIGRKWAALHRLPRLNAFETGE